MLNEKVETDEILKETVMIDLPKECVVRNVSKPDWKNRGTDLRNFRESNCVVRRASLRDLMVWNFQDRRAKFMNFRDPDLGNKEDNVEIFDGSKRRNRSTNFMIFEES